VPAGVIREAAERFAKAPSAAAMTKLHVHVSLISTVTAWNQEAERKTVWEFPYACIPMMLPDMRFERETTL
jgi:hypothetical protein